MERKKKTPKRGLKSFMYILINITSDVIDIVQTLDEAKKLSEQTGFPFIKITEPAAMLAQKLGNLRESDRFYIKRDFEYGLITLDNEVRDNSVFATFKFRVETLSRIWDKINLDILEDEGDILVYKYMEAADPIWRIYTVNSESAAVISNAKVDEIEVEPKPMFFTSTTPLFLNVIEFMYVPGDEFYAFSLSITNNSEIRMILGFSVNEDGTIDTNRGTMYEGSAEHKLYLAAKHFIESFYALRQCEKTPIIINNPQERKNASRGLKMTKGVSTYHVSLSKRYKAIKRSYEANFDKSNKTLTLVSVSGFVRTQHYGEGNKLTKKIWVDGFTRGQWVRNGLTYVSVNS